MQRISIGGIIYLIIGFVVASNHGYLTDLTTLSHLLSALLAIILWPVLLFGANLHLVF
jgi:hypothetical protein